MCTLEKSENLFYLTLTGDAINDEHCLNPTVISSIRSALSEAKSKATPDSVLITIAHGKYFCNGYNINPDDLAADPIHHTSSIFKTLAADFISLPMPTIAIVTGHAVGSGLALAMCHDYVVMQRGRGVLYMCEIHMGISLPDFGVELIKSKVANPDSLRDILLGAMKVKADQAVAMGLVDMAYDSAESAMEGGVRMGKELAKKKFDGDVYAEEWSKMCTLVKRGNIFILTLTGEDDHRLNPTLISSIRAILSEVKSQCVPGSALITIGEGKYFSNGFDLNWAKTSSSDSPSKALDLLLQMVDLFKQLVADLVSLQMPTIAAITGHAAAAGLILAISHDYVLMRRDRGILYMPEIDIGMTLPDYFIAMMRSKVGKPEARRDILLRGVKVKAEEGMSMGLVDSVHEGEESVVEAAVRFGEELANRKWYGEVYAEIRKSLHPELCDVLKLSTKDVAKPRF